MIWIQAPYQDEAQEQKLKQTSLTQDFQGSLWVALNSNEHIVKEEHVKYLIIYYVLF